MGALKWLFLINFGNNCMWGRKILGIMCSVVIFYYLGETHSCVGFKDFLLEVNMVYFINKIRFTKIKKQDHVALIYKTFNDKIYVFEASSNGVGLFAWGIRYLINI